MDRQLNRVVTIQSIKSIFNILLCTVTNKWGVVNETSKEERGFCKCSSAKTGEKYMHVQKVRLTKEIRIIDCIN